MPELAFTPGPKVAGKRIPVPGLRHKRTTAATARTAARAVTSAPKVAAASAPKVAASAATAPGVVGSAARGAARAAGDAGRVAGTAGRVAGTAGRAAGTAARSAKTGAETGRAAMQFAQNVRPRERAHGSRSLHRAPVVTAAIAAGASLEYLLDPTDGRRRRRMLRDQTLAAGRRLARRGSQHARYMEGKAEGAVRAATSTSGR